MKDEGDLLPGIVGGEVADLDRALLDAVKIAELSPEVRREAGLEVDAEQGNGTGETQKMVLFPVISIGDAP